MERRYDSFTKFFAKFLSKLLQIIIFDYLLFFHNLKMNKIELFINRLICPKAKSATHCLTELFPIYQNKKTFAYQTAGQSYHRPIGIIILKIVGFLNFI